MTASTVSSGFEIGLNAIEAASLRKIARRLMPILTLAFSLNYLVRGNIGFAALQMNQQVGLAPEQFGFGSGLLSVAYCAFAIPSNLLLYRFGVRRWLALIMVASGIAAAGSALIAGSGSFYLLRSLLGATEAGFFPGVTFLLSTWFPAHYRARMLAVFLLGAPVSAMIAGPLSGALLALDQSAGLAGWRWMFIAEGLPAVLLGFAMPRIIADRPATAAWLQPEERIVVEDLIASEARYHELTRLRPALTDRRVLLLALIEFGFTTGSYGVGLWLPQIINPFLRSDLAVGFMSAIPYMLSAILMLVWARRADRGGRQVGNLALACLLAAGSLASAIAFPSPWLSFLWLTVALIGVTAARAIFWTIPPRFLTGAAAAGGLALINSIGALGGFAGPVLVGWLKQETGAFAPGLAAMAGFLLLSTALAAILRAYVPKG